MAYKKKEKISLMLYYDYLEQFECLSDEQLRNLIYAMIEFDKNGNEIEMDKVTKMAFIPIKKRLKLDKEKWVETCEKNSENAKKRWGGKNATVCDGMPKVAKYADIEKEKEKEKGVLIDTIENIVTTPPTDTDTIFNFCFSLFENYEKTQLEKSCKKFFNYYQERQWKNVKDWKNKLIMWLEDDIEKGKIKRNKKRVEVINGITYEDGIRIL